MSMSRSSTSLPPPEERHHDQNQVLLSFCLLICVGLILDTGERREG